MKFAILNKFDTAYHSLLMSFFKKVVLKYPKIMAVCILAVTALLGYGIKYFRLDASAETLVLQDDKDLQYSRQVAARYGERDFLVLTFTPNGDLFSDKTLSVLGRLRDDLQQASGAESVTTIVDVPLLESPPVPLNEMNSTTRTLSSADVNMALARKELGESPLYRDQLVSADLKMTAILITFPPDVRYDELLQRRNGFYAKERDGTLTAAEKVEMKKVVREFTAYRDEYRQKRHHSIAAIRAVMEKYRSEGSLFLGGVSMIADDMISFIKNDLKVFGTAAFLLMAITIASIFRRYYWVLSTMLICAVSVIWTVGILGWAGGEVTVISSNFISLQLIITLAMTIHLMVRYREFNREQPNATQHGLIVETVDAMLRPCMYSGFTTIAGFASLIFCNIKPVIDFGYIMMVGVAISMIVPFLLLPVILSFLPKDRPVPQRKSRWQLTPMLGRFTVAHGRLIIVISVVLLVANAFGISRLKVENCFINYFRSNTEINQGLKVIDNSLGGTTSLDVVLDLGQAEPSDAVVSKSSSEEDADFEQFEEEGDKHKYWFTPEKMTKIAAVHDYLESLPDTGKVVSVVTLVRMIERANGKPLDTMELALLFNLIPQQIKDMLVAPYVSIENNQIRLSVRTRDSSPTLKRNELLNQIRSDLASKLGFKPEQVHLAGIMVLYNNMLQSLYTSQVVTLGFATFTLLGTFVILFRSVRIAIIAIFPNLVAISCVLGVMGWLNIPLDMMTITIAAIGVGLADDDTIHYIHRFKHEVEITGDYKEALHRSHDSIGHAIYYTTATLVIGFSILSLSNFIPTIYFGMLTVLAITMALFASLTLLPQLLVVVKPYGKKPNVSQNHKEGNLQCKTIC
jgi:predicted RND superfamily exporter protein